MSDETLVGRVATTLEEEMEPYIGPPSSYTVTARAILLEVADAVDEAYERGERVAGWSTNDPDVKTHAARWLREQAAEEEA